MMIPLPVEEYFQDETTCCMSCHSVHNLSNNFYLMNDETITLCHDCSFGVFQCSRCRHLVSHLNHMPYRELVYGGSSNTFNNMFIFCRECFDFLLQQEDDTLTDINKYRRKIQPHFL